MRDALSPTRKLFISVAIKKRLWSSFLRVFFNDQKIQRRLLERKTQGNSIAFYLRVQENMCIVRAHIPSDLAFCLSFIRHCKCSLSYWYRCCRNWSSFYHREVLQERGKAMINCHWCSLYNQDLAGKGALPWLSCPSVTDKFVCNDQVYLTKSATFAPSVGSFISATTTKKWHCSRISEWLLAIYCLLLECAFAYM